MFAYRVMVTTLMGLEMVTLILSGLQCEKKGKIVSILMFLVLGMGIIAIWG